MAGPVYDPTVSAKNQQLQGGNDWVIAGNLQIDKADGGHLFVGGAEVTATAAELNADTGRAVAATITPAPGASGVSQVSIQLVDANGANIAAPVVMDVWLSDAASGAGLTATAASGAVAGSTGTDFAVLTTKKALRVQTNAAGLYVLSITDTAKTGFFVCAQVGHGKTLVSAQLTAANYG